MKNLLAFIGVGALFLVTLSCSDTDVVETPPPPDSAQIEYTFAMMDVSSGNPSRFPLPNDILRNPVTGQVSVPTSGDPVADAPINALNTLYGFSTSGSMFIPFDGALVAESVNTQSIVIVDTATFQPVATTMQVHTDDSGNSTVEIRPVYPMQPTHTHIVVVTPAVIGSPSNISVESDAVTLLTKSDTPLVNDEGHSTRAILGDAEAQALEPLRMAYQQIWGGAEAITGMSRYDIPMAFAFTTQPLHETLPALRARVQAETPTPTIVQAFPTPEAVDAFYQATPFAAAPHEAIGEMYIGVFEAPMYLHDPAMGPFQGSGDQVVEAGRELLQFMVALPAGRSGQPVPAVIYQHGITTQKETMMAMANAACANGVAVIAIDMVLHGSRVGDSFNNATGGIGGDGEIDSSGTGYINLVNLMQTRDNVRQSVADLYALTRMLTSGAADFNGDGSMDLLPAGITFVGMSLGSIVGTDFVATEPNVSFAVLNVGGARVPQLLLDSASFSPSILAGLSAAGLEAGTPEFNLFMMIAQTVFDDADPFNYASHIGTGALMGGQGTPVLVQEMVDDLVVPNSSTTDLTRALSGISQVDALVADPLLPQVASPFVGNGYYQFEGGSHSSLLDPTTSPAATFGMQFQAYSFLFTGLATNNPTVINPFASSGLAQDNFTIENGLQVNPHFVVTH